MDTYDSGSLLIYQLIGMAIAAVIAVLIAKDANSRGMSGIGWGIFTFLLCIVAVPVYLVVRKPRNGERP
jgi:ABC-type spermidine/putrescine transport system permease subunit I